MFDIPIITYHKISDQKEFGLTTVSTAQFADQMNYLDLNGYKTVRFKDLSSYENLPKKPIIITFDDGYESVYHNAVPILSKYNFKSVIFVLTDFLGKYNIWEAATFQQKYRHLSKDQILELSDRGHEIASHGNQHRYLPLLNSKDLKEEIEDSKSYLESLLKEEITTFCYPYGRYSTKILDKVQQAGYAYATSNLRLTNEKENPYCLQRRSVYSNDSLSKFISKIRNHSPISVAYLSEILIQKGSLASIGINYIRPSKSQFLLDIL
jgi:peptidoglycan/xylan/chitin deacetylase (PgdA/CDA1 family)